MFLNTDGRKGSMEARRQPTDNRDDMSGGIHLRTIARRDAHWFVVLHKRASKIIG